MNDLIVSERVEVPWIGEIPDGWSVKRLKYIFSEKKSIKNPTLSSGSISFGRVIFKDDESIPESTKESYQEVLEGEFLINPLNLNYDLKSLRIGLSRINVVVSQGYIVLRLKDGFYPQYYEYLMRKFDVEHMKSLGQGVRQTISFTHIKDEELVVPPIEEQKLISRYLDKKTEQIDRLVEKIQKKIDLLKEQRTSLINQCVTKGLDPNVEMKDSGVEWIGEIPKHWKVTKLKYLCPKGAQYGLNIESEFYKEIGIRFLRITDINSDGTLKSSGGVFLPEEDIPKEYFLNKNDILFSRSGGTVGKSLQISSTHHRMSFAGYLVRFSFHNEEISRFVKWVSESSMYWSWINLQTIQSTIQNVNGEKYANFSFSVPSDSDISNINDFLSEKTSKIKDTINKFERKIDLLSEYRLSLISSVVTGKVRVTEDMI